MDFLPKSNISPNRHLWRFAAGVLCLFASFYASAHAEALAALLEVSKDLIGDIRSFLLGTGVTLLFFSVTAALNAAVVYFGNLTYVFPAWRSSMRGYVNEFHVDATQIDYERRLRTSRSCVVVLNDGFHWVKRNWTHLVSRVNAGLPITFVICHPDSPWLGYIAAKSNKDEHEQKNDILQCVAAIRLLAEINGSASVKIFGSRLINCYAGFLFEEALYVSPYHTRYRQDYLPAIELRKPLQEGTYSAFGMFKTDIDEQIRNCMTGSHYNLRDYPAFDKLPHVDLQIPAGR